MTAFQGNRLASALSVGATLVFVALTVGVILLVVGAATWYHQEWVVYHGYTPLPFSRDAWLAADAEARGHMLNDLLAKHPLVGQTTEAVHALLGPPDSGGRGGLRYSVGYRGFNPRVPLMFPYTLFIDLNAQGRVEQVFIGD